MPSPLWALDPTTTFLNHGSFGACPVAVLEVQRLLRERMERQPVQFLARDLEPLLDQTRAALGAFVGARPEDLVFVPNATAGVNTVVRSLAWAPGDEVLVTDHAYGACRKALEFVAGRAGARVVVAHVPFPLLSAQTVLDAVMAEVTPRTRLAMLDHVTSPTGLILPIEGLVGTLQARGVDVLVDGAHAPGMLALDLDALGAAYYTGNAHKWLCAPKGAAFLQVRRDRQSHIHPLSISHGFGGSRADRSTFHLEFDWTGTLDPTAVLSIPAALGFMQSRLPGGWPEVMACNRTLALAARQSLCAALDVMVPSPDEMIGALASVPLPDGPTSSSAAPGNDTLQRVLREDHGIEVPVVSWPQAPRRLLRVSAQLYNTADDFARLATVLKRFRAEGML